MTTLAVDAPMTKVEGNLGSIPIIANDIVYEGAMVGDNGAGYGRPLVAGDKFRGHAISRCDNTVTGPAGKAGSAGDLNISLWTGRYRLIIDLAGAITDVDRAVYASDDATYTFDGSGNSFVGIVKRYVSATQLEVEFMVGESDGMEFEITHGPILSGGSYQGTYEVDTTQNYDLGTRRENKWGDVFYYAKAGTLGVRHGFGAAFMTRCYSSGATSLNEALHVQAEIGDTTITMEQASVAANAFAGGICTIGGGATGTERHRIVSNTASADSTNHVVLTLAEPIRKQWTTSAWVECMVNQWGDTQCIVTAGNEYSSFGGIPAVDADSGEYYWCQTWGIVFIVPGGGDAPGDTAREREVYFVGDGSVNGLVTAGSTTGLQRAGFIVQKDASGQGGPPYVMLQIAP